MLKGKKKRQIRWKIQSDRRWSEGICASEMIILLLTPIRIENLIWTVQCTHLCYAAKVMIGFFFPHWNEDPSIWKLEKQRLQSTRKKDGSINVTDRISVKVRKTKILYKKLLNFITGLFFMIFIRKIVRKSWAFFHFTFFPGKKRFNFSSFHFSIQKSFLHKFYVLLFFPVKKDLFFTVLKLSTIKQAFIEKVQ